jgi:hypothetical protein
MFDRVDWVDFGHIYFYLGKAQTTTGNKQSLHNLGTDLFSCSFCSGQSWQGWFSTTTAAIRSQLSIRAEKRGETAEYFYKAAFLKYKLYA